MVEFDGTVEVVGPDGPVPFLDLFQGRDELVVYKHMWHDGAPHQGQCEGCTTTAWHLKDAVYLNARGVSFAILTTGRWDEVASYVEFMGYTQPWYSVRGVDAPVGGSMGYLTCFLRDGDRVFLTYSTTGRGNERGQRVPRPARHDALRPRRGVGGQARGLARGASVRAGTGARTRTATPPGARPAAPCRSGPAPVRLPWRPSAGTDVGPPPPPRGGGPTWLLVTSYNPPHREGAKNGDHGGQSAGKGCGGGGVYGGGAGGGGPASCGTPCHG